MARPKLSLEITPAQQKDLDRLFKAPSTPQKLIRRICIVQMAAQGLDNAQIATQLKTSRPTVGMWRQRFIDLGMAGVLEESPRPGRPQSLETQKVQRVLNEVVRPPAHRKRWSCRSMAKHAGLSKASVQRIWAANDLKPHLTRTFKLSNDPDFEAKF